MGILSTLPSVFIGGGEVKNFTFTKVLSSDKAYVFKVETSDGSTHYETIKRLVTPVCVDFEKKDIFGNRIQRILSEIFVFWYKWLVL